jgi:hypothetical protein
LAILYDTSLTLVYFASDLLLKYWFCCNLVRIVVKGYVIKMAENLLKDPQIKFFSDSLDYGI